MLPAPHRLVPLDHPSQVGRIRRDAMAIAREAGLKPEDAERAGIIATEMATNVVKFAGGDGAVLLHPEPDGVELIALDRGPGIPDGQAEDRVSSVGTLGTGLGAIRRLSDRFALHTVPQGGTVLVAGVGARRAAPVARDAAGISVAAAGESDCGDAWFVRRAGGCLQLGVIDALGHGVAAAVAVRRCSEALDGVADEDLAGVLHRLHDALPGSRCAVAMVAEIAGDSLRSAGIGNIAARLLTPDGGARRLISHPGILGQGALSVRVAVTPFPPGSVLVMHSDGISQKWRPEEVAGLRHPAVLAATLLRDHRNPRDDATVLVAAP